MKIIAIRHAWPEKGVFEINRPEGRNDFTFLHFFQPMQLKVNNIIYITNPGACIFYSPNTPQWFRSETNITHDWIHIDSSLSYYLHHFNIVQNRIYYPEQCGFITEIFKELENEWFSEKQFSIEYSECKLTEFLINFSRQCTIGNSLVSDSKNYDSLVLLRQQIMLNLDKKWTIKNMSDLANLSPSRFHILYRTIFGVSPINDLIFARISTAKNRLVGENITVCRLANELGYSNQYHFIRQFTKNVGCSPSAYRKKSSNIDGKK